MDGEEPCLTCTLHYYTCTSAVESSGGRHVDEGQRYANRD